MSVKGFIAGLFGGGNQRPASEAIMHHVEGSGTGFELDDLVSWSPTPEQQDKVVASLLNIHERYRSDKYPIGTTNPASFTELRLAARLAAAGL